MAVTFLLLAFSPLCAAWDGVVVGKITKIDVASNGDNFGFRVTLQDAPKLCGNNQTWAYINKSDSNYQTLVSVLLAAKMANNDVVLYSNATEASYCHIGYVALL